MSHFGAVDARGPAPKKMPTCGFRCFLAAAHAAGCGILERGVRGPARAAVLHRIKHLEYTGATAAVGDSRWLSGLDGRSWPQAAVALWAAISRFVTRLYSSRVRERTAKR